MTHKATNVQGLTHFQKGVSGNPKGRPPAIPDVDILLREVFTEEERRSILIALKKQAIKGNMRAIEVILDRLYGKVKVQAEISGNFAVEQITGIIVIRDDAQD